jgi:hypothetical protein
LALASVAAWITKEKFPAGDSKDHTSVVFEIDLLLAFNSTNP